MPNFGEQLDNSVALVEVDKQTEDIKLSFPMSYLLLILKTGVSFSVCQKDFPLCVQPNLNFVSVLAAEQSLKRFSAKINFVGYFKLARMKCNRFLNRDSSRFLQC